MIVKRLPTGMLSSNCYIIGDNGEAVIIDPGVESSEILDNVKGLGLEVKYILLTHSHIDHICYMSEVRESTGAKIVIHEKDAVNLSSSWHNGSALFGLDKKFGSPDMMVKDGDTINIGGLTLEIIHTPGHTPGGICIKAEENLFTGDTLFRMSIGRTDLGNGDYNELMDSIKGKLMKLDDDIIVYPGHGASTTIGEERNKNPFI